MTAISPVQVWLANGSGGAYVDVTSRLKGTEGITYTWGRTDQFRDVTPGVVSFMLDNYDGALTPGNLTGAVAAGFALATTEGMGVSWLEGTRLVHAKILSFDLPSDNANWGRITIAADDMLGDAGRTSYSNLLAGMQSGSGLYGYWPMTDALGSSIAAEASGNGQPPLGVSQSFNTPVLTFQQPAVTGIGDPQLAISNPTLSAAGLLFSPALVPISYPSGSLGAWGIWFTPVVQSANGFDYFEFSVSLVGGAIFAIAAGRKQTVVSTGAVQYPFCTATGASGTLGTSSPVSGGALFVPDVPVFLSMVVTTTSTQVVVGFYANGVLQRTTNITPTGSPTVAANNQVAQISVAQINDSATLTSYRVSHLSHTTTQVHEEAVNSILTEAARAQAVASTVPGASLSASASLSTSELSPSATTTNALDGLNDIARTEQGYLYTSTAGTGTAPVETMVLRDRARSATPAYTFDTQTEIQNAPQFIRDITNAVRSVLVQGPDESVTVTDSSARGGSTSERVLFENASDLTLWGQDRVQRGESTSLRVLSVTVDNITLAVSRATDLLAMKPGDRIRFNNIQTDAATVLGFTYWDGWLLGVTEHHAPGPGATDSFTMSLAPVLPDTGIYDTNRYMADGALTLSAAITTTSATTMTVATTGPTLEQVDVPYDLLIDSEQVTVTVCTGATPQVATITRGVNGTTATSHTTSAVIEIATSSLYAF